MKAAHSTLINKNWPCFFFMILVIFFQISCGEIQLSETNRNLAISIAYGTLDMNELTDLGSENTKLNVDEAGRITLVYTGEVLRENANKIFPPVPGIFDFPILDTVAEVPLPVNSIYVIDKGIFNNTSIFFNASHEKKEKIKFKMSMVDIVKGNEFWTQTYELDFSQSSTISTPPFNLNNWIAFPKNNKIKFQYTALRPDGTKVKFQSLAMKFDLLRFSYLEGYFGNHNFDIAGNNIKINLFEPWKSGGIEFEAPSIRLSVDNAFGFPVRSKVNQLTALNVDGSKFDIKSEYIEKGIDFAYPKIGENGSIKNTNFQFDTTNSNIKEIFKNKIVQLVYDFDAVANPNGYIGIKNYFNADAFFSVKVDVAIPLSLKINQFTISDTFKFNLNDRENIKALDLVLNTKNKFPISMSLSAAFLDAKGNILYTIDGNQKIKINPAVLGSNGKTISPQVDKNFLTINENSFSKIVTATDIIIFGNFDTSTSSNKAVSLFNDYNLDLEIGAIIKTK
jgi:hypothetical protein